MHRLTLSRAALALRPTVSLMFATSTRSRASYYQPSKMRFPPAFIRRFVMRYPHSPTYFVLSMLVMPFLYMPVKGFYLYCTLGREEYMRIAIARKALVHERLTYGTSLWFPFISSGIPEKKEDEQSDEPKPETGPERLIRQFDALFGSSNNRKNWMSTRPPAIAGWYRWLSTSVTFSFKSKVSSATTRATVVKPSDIQLLRQILWRTTKVGILFFCVCHTISRHLGEFVICTGPSMHPTIQDGDIVVAERLKKLMVFFKFCKKIFGVTFSNIHRGDIVGCLAPQDPNQLLCKRVINKEGDFADYEFLPNNRIPRGHVFLMGDNRVASTDSRHYGPVPEGLIQVRLALRIWPLDRFGWISQHWFWKKEGQL